MGVAGGEATTEQRSSGDCDDRFNPSRVCVPFLLRRYAPWAIMPDPVRLVSVVLGDAEERLVLEVLRSGQLAQGPKVERLEELFREAAGTAHAVAVSSGTAALVASLDVLGLRPGDEVITSPLTFGATLNAIIKAGATARFADIGEDLTIDPGGVAELINQQTRALMPVHLYGLPADMPRIVELAEGSGVSIIEDAAQAVGAAVAGRPVGSFGLGCFSLYATKNVTSGEGGVVTTDDRALADELRLLRNQGMREKYRYERIGDNLRLTDVQAAVAIPQMEHLSDITDRRRRNAAYLTEGLRGIPGLELPEVSEGRTHVFHQFTVRVHPDAALDRDELAPRLADAGVQSSVYYPHVVFDHACYADHPQVRSAEVPRAREAATQVLSLPVHQHLSRENLDTVVEAVGHLLRA